MEAKVDGLMVLVAILLAIQWVAPGTIPFWVAILIITVYWATIDQDRERRK